MNTRALRLLEYNKITDLLAEQAGSALTRERIHALTPMSNRHQIEDALTETTEAVSVILYKGNIPIGEVGDISRLLAMARKGRSLTMRELLMVKRSLTIARDVRNFLTHEVPELRMIREIVQLIEALPALESDIDRCILSEDEMADSASQDLRRIRRDIRNKNDSIRTRLYKMTGSASYQKFLQDAIVTMRNGRYVIPVKKEYAGAVPGLVHDQSQSGSTLFIEPQSIVTMNNELKELEAEERAEVDRILRLLSGRVAEHYHAIVNNQKLLLELDFIHAKGKLSCLMDGTEPVLNEQGVLEIRKGRHPLIPKDKVVPIDVSLGETFSTLLITGPNTGGKTVTLKTIGLFILMAESGLHLPCREGSRIPILEDVFADIGDEQSIEQSLSTFSAHMQNIIGIFEAVSGSALVLLDELGAGTDPAEGAALGIAELEMLKRRGALVVATTHYTELKKYALSTEGVENASMEFDVETLSPTYRLRVGLPGKSNAFEIAGKLGLERAILDRAEALLGENELSFEDAVTRVEEEKNRAEVLTLEAEELRREMNERLERICKEEESARKERERLLREAREEAGQILSDAEGLVDEVKEDLRRLKNDARGHEISVMADSRRKLREAARRQRREEPEPEVPKESAKKADPARLVTGARVKLLTLGQNGTVLSAPDSRGNLFVQIGPIKTSANIRDLVLIEEEKAGNKERKRREYTKIRSGKARTISLSLNVIGRNLDDALMEVSKYIDDAYLAGVRSVTIVHGRGEGILKEGIRKDLKRNRFVKSFRPAPYNQGGEGATVVELKE